MSRPLRFRDGARIVVQAGRFVLLVRDTDPGVPGSAWWVTPGGGIDDGEAPADAAARELHEETGLRADVDSLLGPVAHRVAIHGYSDRILVQREWFFLVSVAERFDPAPAHLTATERQRMTGLAWFDVAGLPTPLWPSELGQLILERAHASVDLGVVEESTVPILVSEREQISAYLRGLGLRSSE